MPLTNEDLQAIALHLEPIQKEISNIQMILENKTNYDIKLIAEGKFDSTRNLYEDSQFSSEREKLLIRIKRLENELRLIKDRMNKNL